MEKKKAKTSNSQSSTQTHTTAATSLWANQCVLVQLCEGEEPEECTAQHLYGTPNAILDKHIHICTFQTRDCDANSLHPYRNATWSGYETKL